MIVDKLKEYNLINSSGKISPWLERKIPEELKELILKQTNFLSLDYSLSDRLRIILLDVKDEPVCACGSPLKFHKSIKAFSETCSNTTCVSEGTKIRRRETFRKKYGGNYFPTISLDRRTEIAKKAARQAQKNIKKKYGVDNVMQVEEIKAKHYKNVHRGKKMTFPIGKHHSQSHYTEEQKYYLNNLDLIYQDHIENEIPITILSKKYGFSNSFLLKLLSKRGYQTKVFGGSYIQQEFASWFNEELILNDRAVLDGKEIDIWFPEYKLGVEIDGLFWHSANHTKTDRYHKEKLEISIEKDVKLIRFTSEEIETKKDIVCSIISNHFGKNQKIFARKCEIKEVSKTDQKTFLENNHIQGYINSKVAYGLYYDHELIMLASFGKPRFNKNYQWEVLRTSAKMGINVIGGLSKLLNHFEKNYNPDNLISYVDRRYFNGSSLLQTGFKHIQNTDVGYYYCIDKARLAHRLKYQKHKLKNLLENFDPNLTEKENMIANGYRIYYDCGQSVFSKIYK